MSQATHGAEGHVAVIGCGNIGAALCDLLARMPEVKRLTLVDVDVYSAKNLGGQAVSLVDIGVPKARAQARRIKGVRKDIAVSTHVCRVEDLPWGALQSDVICSCLDSRISRMAVNELAWRLGVPSIDAGVLASSLLARTEVFLPGSNLPCFECAFTKGHYDTVEVPYACHNGQTSVAPTNAPAYLGALAASLQASECHKLLVNGPRESDAGLQLVYGLKGHEQFVSRNRRNTECRFDHTVFRPTWSGTQTLEELLFANGNGKETSSVSITAPNRLFILGGLCSLCGRSDPKIRCAAVRQSAIQQCRFCSQPSGVHPGLVRDRLFSNDLPKRSLSYSPRSLGLRNGDLFTITDSDDDRHYLLGELNDLRRKEE